MWSEMVSSCLFARLGRGLKLIWRESRLRRFCLGFAAMFHASLIGQAFFAPRPPLREGALCYRAGDALNRWMFRAGKTLRPVLEDFCLARLWRWLRTRKTAEHSFLLGHLILQQGFHRVFLALFALYLPLDVLLRAMPLPSVIPSLWDEAFLLFGIGYALLRPLGLRQRQRPRVSGAGAAVLLLCGTGVLLLGLISPRLGVAVAGLRAVVQYMLWFFVVIRLIDDEDDIQALLKVFVLLGTLVGLHGIYQYIIGVEIPSEWVAASEVGVRTRAFSIVGSPNILGDLMVLLAPLAASLAYSAKTVSRRLFYWGCVVVMGLCCIVTFSRGAWVGFGVAVVLFALMRDRRLLLVLLAVFLGALCIPEIYNRVAFLLTPEFVHANTHGGRGSRWVIGLNLLYLKSNPLLGYGLGRFGGAVAMQNQTEAGLQYFYMDNYYLKVLVEMGYLGLGSYLLSLAVTLLSGLRSFARAKPGIMKNASVGIFAASCGVLTHCFFENIFEVPYMTAYFWGLLAILVWIGQNPKKA